ncbi:MAG TPA: LysR family transcriptional regulator [Terracidiphilus sp.]
MNTTIDQWEVFQAVVQLGSFAAAAEKLNRSQSTISYAISRLQEQFKVPLFEMSGRRAHLTEEGKALLADAEPLLTGFRNLEEKAASLAAGEGKSIRISVDSLYPDERLFSALAKLNRKNPLLCPQIEKGPFLSAAYEFETNGADLCITGLPAREHFAKPILDIRMRAVARADHPLHGDGRELTRLDLIQHLAVVIEGTNLPEPKRQPHAKTQRLLVVHSVESAIEAVRSGMCFGWLPVFRIAAYLSSGELVGLRLPLKGERLVRMFLVLKESDSVSVEKNLLADLLGANGELEVL